MGCSCCSNNGGCGCQCKNCSCSTSQCCCQKSNGDQGKSCNFAEKFLELADQAWMEVLKEKIKENIRSHDKNLDELAKLISETNHERWQKKMESKKCCGHFEEKIKAFFDGSCSSCQTKPKNH